MVQRLATAEWADPELVERSYAYRDGTVWLGRTASETGAPIGYRDDRHVCLVSGSRGGKGTSFIIPAAIQWPGSLVVLDPKGENATVTAARRGRGSKDSQGLGQTVWVLDPFRTAQVEDDLRGRFNPLDALDPDNPETVDEVGRVADALVVMHPETKDPFWDESARALIKGLILHIVTAPQFEGRRSLVTLRKLILQGDWEAMEIIREKEPDTEESGLKLVFNGMIRSLAFDGLVAAMGDSFRTMFMSSPKQFESVLQVANRNTEFIDSPGMAKCLETSDFMLDELKTRPEGLSLFLCLPQRYMGTHYRWLRMMISLTITEMEKVRGRPASGHPVLMILDEFAGLKRMEIIEQAVAQIAGHGVKLFFVLQSLEQLKAVYKDNWETFLANSGLKIFFNLEDHFSREYVSKLIGETEVVREVKSASEGVSESEGTSRSSSRSQSTSRGRSTSTGLSETEGSNVSVSTGRTGGTSSSKTTGTSSSTSSGHGGNDGLSWEQGNFFGFKFRKGPMHASSGTNWSRSQTHGSSESSTEGTSEGWSEGRSEGTSRGTSRSRTDGTSETEGTSLSETEGTTRGTSKSRTAGSSETIQKRLLITPDEIGQVFARIDDPHHPAYPGLALVVISGTRPVAVHRVNYYEDYQFFDLFDPHPDHPLPAHKELTVTGESLGPYLEFFDGRLTTGPWAVKTGEIVREGTELLPVLSGARVIGQVRAPRLGIVAGDMREAPRAGPWFRVRHYEDGAAEIDPFAEVRAYCTALLAPKPTLPPKRRRFRTRDALAAVGVLVIISSAARFMTRSDPAVDKARILGQINRRIALVKCKGAFGGTLHFDLSVDERGGLVFKERERTYLFYATNLGMLDFARMELDGQDKQDGDCTGIMVPCRNDALCVTTHLSGPVSVLPLFTNSAREGHEIRDDLAALVAIFSR